MPSDDTFQRIEVEKRDMVKTIRAPDSSMIGTASEPPHIMKIEQGIVPTYVKTNPYQMFCWRTMGNFVKKKMKPTKNSKKIC